MARRPARPNLPEVSETALPSNGTIKQSQVIAEFNKGNNLRAYLGAASGVPSSGNLKLTDFYGKTASDAVSSWTYNANDYIAGVAEVRAGTWGLDRARCPWNATGAAFDGTIDTKGTTAYRDAMTRDENTTGGSNIQNRGSGSGFRGPINSQYPNSSSNVAYCNSLFPFQKLQPGNYSISGQTRCYSGDGRWGEAYLYLHFFSTWAMSGGIGYVSGAHSSNKRQVLGGRNVGSSPVPQSGTFTVPEGYEYVCAEFRNANNVYQSGAYDCQILSITVTKTSRLGNAIREKIAGQSETLEIPDDADPSTMEIDECD